VGAYIRLVSRWYSPSLGLAQVEITGIFTMSFVVYHFSTQKENLPESFCLQCQQCQNRIQVRFVAIPCGPCNERIAGRWIHR
jgi:hypothetical protein